MTASTGAPTGRLTELARLFLRLGLTAFGGPAAHIAVFRHEVVVRRRWLTDQQYLDLLGAANILPGPTSTEVAIGVGHARAGWRGMLVSGGLFILPASLIVLALAVVYEQAGALPQVTALLYGVQPVVVAVIAHAVLGLGRAVAGDPLTLGLAVAVGVLALFGVEPLLLLGGGALVVVAVRVGLGVAARPVAPAVLGVGLPLPVTSTAGAGAALGLVPLFLVFAKVGLLVFGSGYVLLAFLRADLVEPGFITDRQLLDAVAVGQVTPGPVFTAATFVGYLLAGIPGAIVATVAVFLPSFVLVGLAHPFLPRIRASPTLSAALDGVNAAALGLIAAVLVELGRVAVVDPLAGFLAVASFVLLFTGRVGPVPLLIAGALAGLFYAS